MSYPNYEHILFEMVGNVAVVQYNHPEVHNAMVPGMGQDIFDVFKRMRDDSEVRAIVLTGAGDKAFSAGAYIKSPDAHEAGGPDEFVESYLTKRGLHEPFDTVEHMPQPVIAAINGHAYGAGFITALCCDIILVSKNASMCVPQVRLGFMPAYGAGARIAKWGGKGLAMKMCLVAEPIPGVDAYHSGLAQGLYDTPKELKEEAMRLAGKLAANAPLSVRLMKESILQGMDIPIQNAASADVWRTYLLRSTDDRAEGHAAWREKRVASFSGR